MSPADAFLARLAATTDAIDTRVLIVAAHPDDEAIGLGGQLPRLRNVAVLHVTDGAPRDGRDAAWHGFAGWGQYAAARRAELMAALALAAIDAASASCLGIADQAASLHLPAAIEGIGAALRAGSPEIVVTHAYEGGHPDHDATACAVHAALARAGRGRPVEMAGYHARPAGIVVRRFLPDSTTWPVALALSPRQRALKRRMLACHATQARTLAQFPVGDAELVRVAPAYDFHRSPHAGRLYYEWFPWGMDGARFRMLARCA